MHRYFSQYFSTFIGLQILTHQAIFVLHCRKVPADQYTFSLLGIFALTVIQYISSTHFPHFLY
jgi:hypothetical protein